MHRTGRRADANRREDRRARRRDPREDPREDRQERTARRECRGRGLAGAFAACLTLGFLPTAVLADGVSGEAWDGSHMLSRHRAFVKEVAEPVSGQTRFGELATGTAPQAHQQVPATIEGTTQRGWQQGVLPKSTGSASRGGHAPGSGSGGSSDPGFGRSSSRGGSEIRAGSVSRR